MSRPSSVNLSQLAREVADTVLAISFAYELGFRWFKSPREEDEKIYNFMKKWKETYNHKIIHVAHSQFWPKCTIPSILLPPHHHVPLGRPRKNRKVSKEGTAEKALKEMIKGGKHSKKGKTVTCSQCGTTGHNKRACTGPRKKNAKGKGKKKARAEGVADSEATEADAGPSQPMDSQSTQEVGSQRRKSIRKASKQAAI